MPDSSQSARPIFTLRTATLADAFLLAHLGARLFEQAFSDANDPENLRTYVTDAFSVEREKEILTDTDRAAWIAEDAGHAAIGYAVLRRGSTGDGVRGVKPAEVQRIYSDRAWHGLGVGDALMRSCVQQARAWHCDVVWLGVWSQNPRAIAFYEKNGFRRVGRQTFAVGQDIQEDFVMALALP